MKTWNDFTAEERLNEVRILNETYDFSKYDNAETAAYNVRLGYENNPDWFSFEVTDLNKFESELAELVREYQQWLEITDERVYAYGYGNEEFCDADIEQKMQDFVDEKEPGRWEVQRADYFEDEDCWSAKIIEINE